MRAVIGWKSVLYESIEHVTPSAKLYRVDLFRHFFLAFLL